MSDELFEGAVINGKEFPFVRITESMQPKILKKLSRLDWRALLYNLWKQKKRVEYVKNNPNATYKDLVKEGLVYISIYHNKREWKIIRSVAFEKNFLWKVFGIIPYELRCNVIKVQDSKDIKKKFDNYLMEATQEPEGQIVSSEGSETKNNNPK